MWIQNVQFWKILYEIQKMVNFSQFKYFNCNEWERCAFLIRAKWMQRKMTRTMEDIYSRYCCLQWCLYGVALTILRLLKNIIWIHLILIQNICIYNLNIMNIYWIRSVIAELNCISMCYSHSNYFIYLNLKLNKLIFIILLKMQMVFYSYWSLSEFFPDLKKIPFCSFNIYDV